MTSKSTLRLILTIFMLLGAAVVYAQPPTDATYIEMIDQDVTEENRRLSTTTSIGILMLLVVFFSVSIYGYRRHIRKREDEAKIQKEGIQKEG